MRSANLPTSTGLVTVPVAAAPEGAEQAAAVARTVSSGAISIPRVAGELTSPGANWGKADGR